MGKKTKTTPKTNKGQKVKTDLVKDERFKVLVGLFILSFAIYSLFGFVSYLFTWKTDQSKLDISLFELMKDATITVENWAGKLGALIAHTFIHNWFGIASVGFILLIGLMGLRLFNHRLLPFRKTLKYVLVLTIWLSLTLGYLFHNSAFMPGGAHGYFLSEWLNSFIGRVGTALVILVALFGILAFSFDGFIQHSRTFLWRLLKRNDDFIPKEEKESIKVAKTEEQPEIVPEPVPSFETKVEKNEIVVEKPQPDFVVTDASKENEVTFDIVPEKPKENKEFGIDNIGTVEVKTVTNHIETDVPKEQPVAEEPTVAEKLEEDLGFEVQISENEEAVVAIDDTPDKDYDPTLDLSNYKLPSIELLAEHETGNVSVSSEELSDNKDRIVETLAHYKIEIVDVKAIVGPTITLYEIVPAPGVRIAKIKNLEDDIALSLAALGIRIIAPIPGKKAVGIEVPNLKPKVVSMRSIIASAKFQESKYELPIALGKTISNETYVLDLAKAPHMLVAGATGQGKSVGLNAILTSLLYKKHPAQLKLVLVDPKKVELTLFQKIENHFLAKLPDAEESIITDNQKVVNTINSLCIEMDARYDLLKDAHTRNIKEYNAKFISRKLNPNKGHKFLPYIVVVIDEFADLIMTAGKEIELPIARLAQLARAIGIHLIVATQRPTTNIITGLIKANFPTRIAFRVMSMMDSRTILDAKGANQLIGRGDMLISEGSEIIRLQCAFVDTPEIEKITDFIGEQQAYPTAFMLPEYSGEESTDGPSVDLAKRDSIFDDAARLIVNNQQGSTSLIQRKFSIGYNRAGRIIDQLEAAGVVGSFEGSKARQVLVPDELSLEKLLNSLDGKI